MLGFEVEDQSVNFQIQFRLWEQQRTFLDIEDITEPHVGNSSPTPQLCYVKKKKKLVLSISLIKPSILIFIFIYEVFIIWLYDIMLSFFFSFRIALSLFDHNKFVSTQTTDGI